MSKFGSIKVRNMVAVGRTTSDTVRLWLRSEKPGEHDLEVWPESGPGRMSNARINVPAGNRSDNTLAFDYPAGLAHQEPLRPFQAYGFRISRTADKEIVGQGRFETAPEDGMAGPEKFSLAVMSCHQPFNSDGRLSERSMRMLKITPRVMEENRVKFVLLCGDQLYSDVPDDFSLINPHYFSTKIMPDRNDILECTPEEVRRVYQDRYRIFWSMEEWQHLLANYPCYPILDDHEIRDDWGSNKEHSTAKYRNFFQGAKAAYFDYQGSLTLPLTREIPLSFHYHFAYGSAAVFVMDIRTQRKADTRNRLYGPDQYRDFDRFLKTHRDKRVLLLVTSVPIVHLPSWLVDAGAALVGDKVDFPDHWTYKKNLPARDKILKRLHAHQKAHPRQRVVIISGDVHIGCVFAIQWKGPDPREPRLFQFTASAVSNRLKKHEAFFSKIPPHLVTSLKTSRGGPAAEVGLLDPLSDAADKNPFGGLNLGLIEISEAGSHSTVNLKLIGYPSKEQWRPKTMFESGEL